MQPIRIDKEFKLFNYYKMIGGLVLKRLVDCFSCQILESLLWPALWIFWFDINVGSFYFYSIRAWSPGAMKHLRREISQTKRSDSCSLAQVLHFYHNHYYTQLNYMYIKSDNNY